MVMKPEPWGEALDALRRSTRRPRCSSRRPAGAPFTQALAARARRPRPPGRRVRPLRGHRPAGPRRRRHGVPTSARSRSATTCSTAARSRPPAMLEAVVRLLPGFMGNPELARRGVPRGRPPRVPRLHQARLLARPRGPARPALRRPRRDRRLAPRRVRTAHRRPPPRSRPSGGAVGLADTDLEIRPATRADAGELFTLTRACWLQEQWANPGVGDPCARGVLRRRDPWSGRLDDPRRRRRRPDRRVRPRPGRRSRGGGVGRRPGDGRARPPGSRAGRRLLALIEEAAPAEVTSYSLFTARAAPTTSGCTRRRATGSAVRPRVRRARSVMTKPRRP